MKVTIIFFSLIVGFVMGLGVGCSAWPFAPEAQAKASVEITDREQHELSSTEKAALGYDTAALKYSSVTVYYKIQNTGVMDIDGHTVWIKVKCKDGSEYTGMASGTKIKTDKFITGLVSIHTAGKEYDSADVDTYEVQ